MHWVRWMLGLDDLDGFLGFLGFQCFLGFQGFLGFLGFQGFIGFLGCLGFLGNIVFEVLVSSPFFKNISHVRSKRKFVIFGTSSAVRSCQVFRKVGKIATNYHKFIFGVVLVVILSVLIGIFRVLF